MFFERYFPYIRASEFKTMRNGRHNIRKKHTCAVFPKSKYLEFLTVRIGLDSEIMLHLLVQFMADLYFCIPRSTAYEYEKYPALELRIAYM